MKGKKFEDIWQSRKVNKGSEELTSLKFDNTIFSILKQNNIKNFDKFVEINIESTQGNALRALHFLQECINAKGLSLNCRDKSTLENLALIANYLPDSIEELRFSGNKDIPVDISEIIAALPNLKILDLSNILITNLPEELPASLEIINLRTCKNLGADQTLPPMDYLNNLKEIDLSGTDITHLPELPDSIEIINLSYCQNLAEDEEFESLNNLPNLKELSIQGSNKKIMPQICSRFPQKFNSYGLADDGLLNLADSEFEYDIDVDNPALQIPENIAKNSVIRLQGNKFNNDNIQDFVRDLRKVEVCNMSVEEVPEFADDVEEITFHHSADVSVEGFASFSNYQNLKKLEIIFASTNSEFIPFPDFPESLEEFSFDPSNYFEITEENLLMLSEHSNLKKITIRCLKEFDLYILYNLPKLITDVSIIHHGLKPDQEKEMLEIIALYPNLQNLDMGYLGHAKEIPYFASENIKNLKLQTNNSQFQILNLNRKDFVNLERLHLNNSRVQELYLPQSGNLQEIILQKPQLSDESIRRLAIYKNKFPEIEIIFPNFYNDKILRYKLSYYLSHPELLIENELDCINTHESEILNNKIELIEPIILETTQSIAKNLRKCFTKNYPQLSIDLVESLTTEESLYGEISQMYDAAHIWNYLRNEYKTLNKILDPEKEQLFCQIIDPILQEKIEQFEHDFNEVLIEELPEEERVQLINSIRGGILFGEGLFANLYSLKTTEEVISEILSDDFASLVFNQEKISQADNFINYLIKIRDGQNRELANPDEMLLLSAPEPEQEEINIVEKFNEEFPNFCKDSAMSFMIKAAKDYILQGFAGDGKYLELTNFGNIEKIDNYFSQKGIYKIVDEQKKDEFLDLVQELMMNKAEIRQQLGLDEGRQI